MGSVRSSRHHVRRVHRVRRIGLGLLLGVALLASGSGVEEAHAIEGAPPWSYAMAHDLMSPFCPGRTLAECPSPQATELRFWILTQASAGASEDEVNAMLTDRFGDVLLAAPRAEGWGLTAYVIPIAFFVIGGPVVVLIIRRLAAGGTNGEASQNERIDRKDAAVDPELERQLEMELGEL